MDRCIPTKDSIMQELFVLTFTTWDYSHVVGVFDSEDALASSQAALIKQGVEGC